MKQSYLIQRLKKPYKNERMLCNPFEFGGGYIRGGICKGCYDALNVLFSFDYMGAAEFEFGIIPEVLGRIYRYHNEKKSVKGMVKIHGIPVYYLCHAVVDKEVAERIKDIANLKFRLKERTFLDEALAARVPDTVVPEKKDKYKAYEQYIGWLELDNDFAFFLDEKVRDDFAEFMSHAHEHITQE